MFGMKHFFSLSFVAESGSTLLQSVTLMFGTAALLFSFVRNGNFHFRSNSLIILNSLHFDQFSGLKFNYFLTIDFGFQSSLHLSPYFYCCNNFMVKLGRSCCHYFFPQNYWTIDWNIFLPKYNSITVKLKFSTGILLINLCMKIF